MPDNVIQSINITTDIFNKLNFNILPKDYRDTDVSMKVVKKIKALLR
jgi:hypothetical protein